MFGGTENQIGEMYRITIIKKKKKKKKKNEIVNLGYPNI